MDSIEVNKEGKITATGETDLVYLAKKIKEIGLQSRLLNVGPAKEEKEEKEIYTCESQQ